VIDWPSLLFSPNGRISRRYFWVGLGIWLAASWLAWLIPSFIAPLLAYLLTWIWACVSIKRLHDMGRSGWLIVAPFIVGTVGFVTSALLLFGGLVAGIGAFNYPALGEAALSSLGGAAALAVIANLGWLGFLAWVGLSHGQRDVNIYGPPPGMIEVL
jgi:uncharacterized membrane protein YhaH (DUF805 family)